MTKPPKPEVSASIEIQDGITDHQGFLRKTPLNVKAPQKFTENGDTYLRLSVYGNHQETHEDGEVTESDEWLSAGISLTPEQARDLGEFLLEVWDDEPEVLMERDEV